MKKYIVPALRLASLQSKRILRDPVGTIILFGLPLLLLIISGAFITRSESLLLDAGLVNDSSHVLSETIQEVLTATGVIRISDKHASLDSALTELRAGDLDLVLYLSEDFGYRNEVNGDVPSGNIELYIDESKGQVGNIARTILNGIILELNQQIIGIDMPLNLITRSVLGENVQAINFAFAILVGLGLFMMGVFGAASLIPLDRKTGALRRLHVMPISSGQLLIGTMLSFAVLSLFLVSIMTAISVLVFHMSMPQNIFLYVVFIVLSTIMALGLGFAISGISKTPAQAEVYGQIIFFGSLAFGGIWVPQAFLPDLIRMISSVIPLSPVIEGLHAILGGSASFADLVSQFMIIMGWILFSYIIGIQTFRWE